MNKIFIQTLTLLVIFGLTSCTYKPVFLEKNYDFVIEKVFFEGEKEINKIIENKINLIKKDNNIKKKKYILNVTSQKKRKTISKNSKGDPLKFEMIITVNYELTKKNKLLLEKKIEKNNIYNNESDQFKLEQSEKIILENISGNISDIIISSIINLDDN